MNRTLYITKDGYLRRKDNTLLISLDDGKATFAPIETIDDIMLLGDAQITTGLLDLLDKKEISMHVFNEFGRHIGDWIPDSGSDSNGAELIAQSAFWLDEVQRHALAVSFVIGAVENMKRVINYYQERRPEIHDRALYILKELNEFKERAWRTRDVPELLGIEGSARIAYYQFFDILIQDDAFKLGKRVRRPPDNPMNALISYINCLCYAMTLSQIRQTRLDPRIAFLHSPSNRRTSLELDLSEIFKPLLVDRLIFTLINKRILKPGDFIMSDNNGVVMTKEARRKVTLAWDAKLDTVITNHETGRKASWRHIVLLEARKLQRHILEGAAYEPFRYKW